MDDAFPVFTLVIRLPNMALNGEEKHFVEEVVENEKENSENRRYSAGEMFLVHVFII